MFKPGTAAAANPVCLSCKTAGPHPRLGVHRRPGARVRSGAARPRSTSWSRTLNHALNCIFCHDPHSAKPRIVRDGLIQALTRPEKDTLWHSDARAAKIDVKDIGVRGLHAQDRDARPLRHQPAVRPVPRRVQLQPGHRPDDRPADRHDRLRAPTTSRSRTSNDIGKHYTDLKFRDFKHGITGALLWKAQHPDVENYYELEAPESRRRVLELPHAQGQGQEDRQALHVALADLARSTTSRRRACSATAAGARSRRCT